ncbi:putative nad dependent epimerase dehydratase protein [Phaeoacremonium minimum UCRPA7]|uniref:Putative nad dependent epimerase dehydratase protein n=1 Tax=Phaeoacremonium minimum (strain UCR-PA7) TaxID=1286976 RepID=R8BHP3_PHAM7|nr:putative nad dependent epimerase dehydratase protein [Phaeoacremonium minimum UCRPA7]EON98816.1 putative nad dependent epimerase dehydratase protein [Phaeoacremonium minimum UCRPA7]
MGQQASAPKPGAKLRVIGAGLPRTGTASFSAALEILLDGPVYHGGTQVCLGPEAEAKGWIAAWQRYSQPDPIPISEDDIRPAWPKRTPEDEAFIKDTLRKRFDGYMATTDFPAPTFVKELVELYPDAKVIVTLRDPEAWGKSLQAVGNTSLQWIVPFALYLLPSLRWYPKYISGIINAWRVLYQAPGEEREFTRKVWDRHIAYLKAAVPPDRLVFYDVRDGWEPLCEALGVEVPKGVEFPKVNEGAQVDEFAKKHIQRGLLRWAELLGAIVVGGVAVWYASRR